MSTSAPNTRIVDALTGERAPSAFFQALEQADERVAALALAQADADNAAEMIGLLLDERDELRAEVDRLREQACRVDDLEDELIGLRQAHQITLGFLAEARAQIAAMERQQVTQ